MFWIIAKTGVTQIGFGTWRFQQGKYIIVYLINCKHVYSAREWQTLKYYLLKFNRQMNSLRIFSYHYNQKKKEKLLEKFWLFKCIYSNSRNQIEREFQDIPQKEDTQSRKLAYSVFSFWYFLLVSPLYVAALFLIRTCSCGL